MKRSLILVTFLMGILLALQVRSLRAAQLFLQRTDQRSVISEIRVFQIANQTLRNQIDEKEKRINDLQKAVAGTGVEDEMDHLALLSGMVPVTGPGIEVTINQSIEAFWMTDIIAQLVGTGAEAVAFNDARITQQNAGFHDVAGGMLMRGDFVKPPYRLAAIGPKEEMRKAIAQPGGIIDRLEKAHPTLKIIVTERDAILMK
ncbi:DUF881 domain-containing protein [Candidatus Gracilibacteria bacterium]|nr:DUF881 domain-containing protein [Candidatus Gracilibacteria bacterium]